VLNLWLRAVLRYHAPYLMSVPDLVKTLSSLYLVVDSRLSSYNRLLKLSGRLDLLTSQVQQFKKQSQKDGGIAEKFDTYYNEEDGGGDNGENSEEDVEDEDEEDDGREEGVNGEQNMDSDSDAMDEK